MWFTRKTTVLVPDWFSFIAFVLNYHTEVSDILSHCIINAVLEIKLGYNWDLNLNQATPKITQQQTKLEFSQCQGVTIFLLFYLMLKINSNWQRKFHWFDSGCQDFTYAGTYFVAVSVKMHSAFWFLLMLLFYLRQNTILLTFAFIAYQ